MTELLTLGFWFTMRGEMTSVTRLSFAVIIFGFIGYFVYLKYTEKKWKKTLFKNINKGLLSFLLVNAMLGFYLWFVFEEQVPMLSARIWILIWIAEMVLWLINIYRAFRQIPQIKSEIDSRKNLNKYIP